MTKRASYREAIRWIAANDEDWNDDDIDFAADMISVQLVADLWRKDPREVARLVLRERKLTR